MKHIDHSGLNGPQEYMSHQTFNNRLTSLLYNLCCRSVNNLKDNFHNQYSANIQCVFGCFSEIDSQEHQLKCYALRKHLSTGETLMVNSVSYNQIFGTVEEQLEVTKVFQFLLRLQKRLLGDDQLPAHHGNNCGP